MSRNPRVPGLTVAHPVNPRRLALGPEQQDGAVVDDDLHVALVVLDAKLVALDGVAGLGVAVGAAEGEEVVVEEREHVVGRVGRLDGDRCRVVESESRFRGEPVTLDSRIARWGGTARRRHMASMARRRSGTPCRSTERMRRVSFGSRERNTR